MAKPKPSHPPIRKVGLHVFSLGEHFNMEPDYKALEQYNEILPTIEQMEIIIDAIETNVLNKIKNPTITEDAALELVREVKVLNKIRSEIKSIVFKGEQAKTQITNGSIDSQY